MDEKQVTGLLQAFADKYKERFDSIHTTLAANQPIIDEMAAMKGKPVSNISRKTLGESIFYELEKKKDELKELERNKNFSFTIDIKTAGVLLASDHLTGDPQANYGAPAIAPRQNINFRDLVRTTPSPTGTQIFYQEGTVTNSFATQTEGAAKASQDYTWTEKKATSAYLAAKTKFSKQLSYNLPFIQNTLALELQRDFYRKENDLFFTTIAGNCTGNNLVTNPTATVDIEEIIGVIANQMSANFTPSFALIDPQEWRRLLTTKPNDYSLPAGTVVTAGGTITIGGCPIVPASWAQTDHILVVDANYVERLETESMRIEFAYQNEDDWVKNLVCARLECFEVINLLRPEACIYKDLGNS